MAETEKIIGRTSEIRLLRSILASDEPELVAIFGRRRVGKTYLIRNVYAEQIIFEFSGIHDALLSQQLEGFSASLTQYMGGLPIARPSTWIEAFQMLRIYLEPLIKSQRKVIFFDEFPWIHSARSGFLQAFDNFWNTWASKKTNLVVVICGSAAAWMIQNIVNNRGGLHNRISRKIRLLPFTIGETKTYLQSRDIKLDDHQILQLYMVMGGIPQYLRQVHPGRSAAQSIDDICFSKDGFLQDEFKNLYYSLFDNAGTHIEIVKALAKNVKGLTRGEIIETCKLTSGGGTTQKLEELTESGFTTSYIPFNKTMKESLYKLSDEFSVFYLRFMENSRSGEKDSWIKFSAGQAWKSWTGMAFESICMKHTDQLKSALGIEKVYTEVSVWSGRGNDEHAGAQIDLLIDRNDGCINICEMKYSATEFLVTKSYAAELDTKIKVFRAVSKTRKALFLTMVTTYGVSHVKNYAGLIENEITMEALFKEL